MLKVPGKPSSCQHSPFWGKHAVFNLKRQHSSRPLKQSLGLSTSLTVMNMAVVALHNAIDLECHCSWADSIWLDTRERS